MNRTKKFISIILFLTIISTTLFSNSYLTFASSGIKNENNKEHFAYNLSEETCEEDASGNNLNFNVETTDLDEKVSKAEIYNDYSEPFDIKELILDLDIEEYLSKYTADKKITVTDSVYKTTVSDSVYGITEERPAVSKYIDVVTKINSFSKATEEEIDIISRYLSIDKNTFLEAEKQGYSVGDSILVAGIIKNTNLDYFEINEATENYEDLKSLYIASKQYASILNKWDFSDKTIEGLQKSLILGFSMLDVEKAAIIAELFCVDLCDIFTKHNSTLSKVPNIFDNTASANDIPKLTTFLLDNHISMDWFLEYTDKEKMNLDDFYKEVENYYQLNLQTAPPEKLEKTELESTRQFSLLSEPEDDYKAPFSYKDYGEDKVEMNTGNLIHENVDVYLPGKNGLDFMLVSRYNSGEPYGEKEYYLDGNTQAQFYNVNIKFDIYLNGTEILVDEGQVARTYEWVTRQECERLEDIYDGDEQIVFIDGQYRFFLYMESSAPYNDTGNYYNFHRWFNPTYSQKDSPLGIGWSFVFDSIEVVSNDSYYNNFLGQTCYFIDKKIGKYLHLENGQIFEIKDTLELEGYKLDDMKLELSNAYTNGQNVQSYYVLKYKDGIRKYFAQDGRLLATVDRFNNRIEYQHTLIRNHPVITKIIDTLNRETTINYDFTNLQVVVTAPDNNQIVYELQQGLSYIDPQYENITTYQTYGYYVSSRNDAENRESSYEYDYANYNSFFYYNFGVAHISNVLTKIIYPTGSYVNYTYTEKTRFFCDIGHETYPSVVKRNLVDTTNNLVNNREYIYSNNYTRYPFVEADKDYWELENLYPESYSYIISDRNKTFPSYEYIFDYKNLMTAQENYKSHDFDYRNNILYKVNKQYMFSRNEFDYDTNYYQILQKRAKTYTTPASGSSSPQDLNKFLLSVEDYNFDQYGNLIKYWGPYANRNSNNALVNPTTDEYLTKYTYDTANYHLLTKKEYKMNSATAISEEYALTSSKKNVAQAITKVNGVQKSKTVYDYDAWNNVSSEKRYLEDGGWLNYEETQYIYQDNDSSRNSAYNFSGAYLTRKSISGVMNVDGGVIGTVEEKYKYDDYGNLIQVIDPNNSATNFEHDNLGRIILKTNPDGTTISNGYDNTNNHLTVTNENGTAIKYIYDSIGNLLYEQDVLSGEYLKAYEYNSDFRLIAEKNNTSGENYEIQYTYYHDGKLESKTTKNTSNTTIAREEYLYDDAFDIDNNGAADCTKITKTIIGDSNSPSITSNTYMDKGGKVFRDGIMYNGQELYNTYQYDYLGNKSQEKSARAHAEGWSWTMQYKYDFAGRLVESTDINNNKSSVEYDALGRVKSKTDAKGNAANPKYSITYTYDKLGRVLTESVPFKNNSGTIINSIKKYYYDNNGSIIEERTTNNLEGSAATYTKTQYAYDNRNRLVKVTTYDNGTPENYTQYYYDNAGNKVRMYTGLSSPLTINGLDNVSGSDTDYSVTKYQYDRFNQLIKLTDPMNQLETYTYDLNGNLTDKTDRNGNVHTFAYDALGRLLSKTVVTPGGTGNETYAYTYTLTGNKHTSTGGGITTTCQYDALGRLIKETETGGIEKIYSYDVANNRKSFVLKQNGVAKTNTSYDYDNMNRLWKVYENGAQTATYAYDANGNRQTLTYNASGNSTDYTYNLANMLVSMTNKKGSSTLSSYSYTYYLDGNQATKTDHTGKVTTYAYDDLGRLENEAPQGETALAYTYDDYSNRASLTVGAAITSYLYDKNNRLITETKSENSIDEVSRYYYDNNGNQTCKTTETLEPAQAGVTESYSAYVLEESINPSPIQGTTLNEYNGFNQLKKSINGNIIAEYQYNADGLRVKKTTNGIETRHIWDGQNIAIELVDNIVAAKYVRGINLIRSDMAGTVNYYLFNGHGDVVQLTGSSGSVIKTYDYDVFGNEKTPDTNDTNPFRYCGEYFDKETGTYYLRARYYNPVIGRFITEDSYLGNNSDPLSLNLYTYCYNNPIILCDPIGNAPVVTGPNAGVRYVLDPEFREHINAEIASALRQLIMGNYADEVSAGGIVLQVGTGLVGIDLPADIRDTVYDFSNWEWSWSHAAQTGLDVIGIVPLIGAVKNVKYLDEAGSIVKGAGKLDQLGNALKAINRGEALSNSMKKALRGQARTIMGNVDAFANAGKRLDVHHLIPLEWSHIMGKGFNPNKLDNLAGIDPKMHKKINSMWDGFRKRFKGNTPTADDVMNFAKKVNDAYGSHLVR